MQLLVEISAMFHDYFTKSEFVFPEICILIVIFWQNSLFFHDALTKFTFSHESLKKFEWSNEPLTKLAFSSQSFDKIYIFS